VAAAIVKRDHGQPCRQTVKKQEEKSGDPVKQEKSGEAILEAHVNGTRPALEDVTARSSYVHLTKILGLFQTG